MRARARQGVVPRLDVPNSLLRGVLAGAPGPLLGLRALGILPSPFRLRPEAIQLHGGRRTGNGGMAAARKPKRDGD
jgi:hypothetical protein